MCRVLVPTAVLVLLVFNGCSSVGAPRSDLRVEQVRLELGEVRGNHEALLYGVRKLDDGRLGNDLFGLHIQYIDLGFYIDIENFTEYPIMIDWRRCALVDYEGWTHNVTHPDLERMDTDAVQADIIIAPCAKRRVPLVPLGAFRRQVNRPGFGQAFHPNVEDIPAGGFSERIILDLEFRGKELTYDLALRYEDPRGVGRPSQ